MKNLTPRQIVEELDRYIIGQADAKRAVAVAIRNRWRRQQLDATMAREVSPKNIVMIGPTGVGKTEIARRLAKLTGAPFIKVEASKFTEVGYHGRDVESMVRDLVDQAISVVHQEDQPPRLPGQTVREERELALAGLATGLVREPGKAVDAPRVQLEFRAVAGRQPTSVHEHTVVDQRVHRAHAEQCPGQPGEHPVSV